MALFDDLNNGNFVLFAAKNYQNRQCQDSEEFYEDLNEFKYVKKLVNRFIKDESEDDHDKVFRLIVNHIVIIYNVFEMEAAHKMLLFKLEETQLTVIKPILLLLNYITERDFIQIPLDKRAVDYCRKIKSNVRL